MLQCMLTATGNNYRRESAHMEFQEALNKACLALIRDWQEQKYKNDRRLQKRDKEEVGAVRSRADSRSDDDVGHAAK